MSTNQIYNEVELLALLKLTSDFPFCTESEDTKTSTTEVIVFALICQRHHQRRFRRKQETIYATQNRRETWRT
jgi:hypothetical protein